MKQFILVIMFLLMTSYYGFSQSTIDSILVLIEKNNTSLIAAGKNVDAEKIGNKTGLMPMNPEAEFNYLWGSPEEIGHRTDVRFTQTIDFPTAYAYRSQLAGLKNRQTELEYERQRKEILLHARMVCIELMYQNALFKEYSIRLTNAKQIAEAYHSKFEAGEIGILEYNKAQVNHLNVSKDLEKIDIERKVLLTELQRLNAGQPIVLNSATIPSITIQTDFEQWYSQAEQRNPMLQWIRQEVTVSQKQRQLNTALSYPKISAGYMSENETREHFQGITLGLSIPLWEDKNKVAYAKAKSTALQSMANDAKLQFYNEMKALHEKVIALQSSVADYRVQLSAFSNTSLLQKALDKGEISLSEYIFELSAYYESVDKLLEMETEKNKAVAELNKYL